MVVLVALLGALFSAYGFLIFNQDMKRVVGTSIATNALLYQTLKSEATLARQQVKQLRDIDVNTRRALMRQRIDHLKQKENAFAGLVRRANAP